jgi:hypothetical protein
MAKMSFNAVACVSQLCDPSTSRNCASDSHPIAEVKTVVVGVEVAVVV